MKWFRKNDSVVDLSERYRKQKEKAEQIKSEAQEIPSQNENSNGSFFSFLGNSNSKAINNEQESSYSTIGESEDKKRKLAKRLSDMTSKVEELSNSIYKIEQRLELIERKMNLN